MKFAGETYDAVRDEARLLGQAERVRALMRDGAWRTLRAIAHAIGSPEASVSARLRDLRKAAWGAHTVERRHVTNGLHEYRLRPPALGPQLSLLEGSKP